MFQQFWNSKRNQDSDDGYDRRQQQRYHHQSKKEYNDRQRDNHYHPGSGRPYQNPYKQYDSNYSRNNNLVSSILYSQSKLAYNQPKSPNPWSEEAQEEARKKELNDAKSKLLNKMKTWNSENGEASDSQAGSESAPSSKPDGSALSDNDNDKPESDSNVHKRIAHVPKIKSPQMGSRSKSTEDADKSETSTKVTKRICYNSSVKDIQRKIGHNIIGELMSMPKENLKKVLDDPKVNPKIEIGMAQLVKENRLILAQQLRNLAESKMSKQFQESQLVQDGDCFIDPDLVVDVCKLPPELIKQMGAMFQLDFENVEEAYDPSQLTSDDESMKPSLLPAMNPFNEMMQNISTTASYLRDTRVESQPQPELPSYAKYLKKTAKQQLITKGNDKSLADEGKTLESGQKRSENKGNEPKIASSDDGGTYECSTEDEDDRNAEGKQKSKEPEVKKKLTLAERLKVMGEMKSSKLTKEGEKKTPEKNEKSPPEKQQLKTGKEVEKTTPDQSEKSQFDKPQSKTAKEVEKKTPDRNEKSQLEKSQPKTAKELEKRTPEQSEKSQTDKNLHASEKGEVTAEVSKWGSESETDKELNDLMSVRSKLQSEIDNVESEEESPVEQLSHDNADTESPTTSIASQLQQVSELYQKIQREIGEPKTDETVSEDTLQDEVTIDSVRNVVKEYLEKNQNKEQLKLALDNLIGTELHQNCREKVTSKLAHTQTEVKDYECSSTQTQKPPEKTFKTSKTQTEAPLKIIRKPAETQTLLKLNDVDDIYGVPIPSTSSDETVDSLMSELKMIDNVVHKINERKFMIFLKLTTLKGGSVSNINSNSDLLENFVHTLTNNDRNVCKQVFKSECNHDEKNHDEKRKMKSNQLNKLKSSEKITSKKPKNDVVAAKITKVSEPKVVTNLSQLKSPIEKALSSKDDHYVKSWVESQDPSHYVPTEPPTEGGSKEKKPEETSKKDKIKNPKKQVSDVKEKKSETEEKSKSSEKVQKKSENVDNSKKKSGESSKDKSKVVESGSEKVQTDDKASSEKIKAKNKANELPKSKPVESEEKVQTNDQISCSHSEKKKTKQKAKKSPKTTSKLLLDTESERMQTDNQISCNQSDIIKPKKKVTETEKKKTPDDQRSISNSDQIKPNKKTKSTTQIEDDDQKSSSSSEIIRKPKKNLGNASKDDPKSDNQSEPVKKLKKKKSKIENVRKEDDLRSISDTSSSFFLKTTTKKKKQKMNESDSEKSHTVESQNEQKSVSGMKKMDKVTRKKRKRSIDSVNSKSENSFKRKKQKKKPSSVNLDHSNKISKPKSKEFIDDSSDSDSHNEFVNRRNALLEKRLREVNIEELKKLHKVKECYVLLERINPDDCKKNESSAFQDEHSDLGSNSVVEDDEDEGGDEDEDHDEDNGDDHDEDHDGSHGDDHGDNHNEGDDDDNDDDNMDATDKTSQDASTVEESTIKDDDIQQYNESTDIDSEAEAHVPENKETEDAQNQPVVSSSDQNKESNLKKKKNSQISFNCHKGPILDMKIFGKYILAASEDKSVYCYSIRTGKRKREYSGHRDAVTCLSVFSERNETGSTDMFTGSLDSQVRCFKLKSSELVKESPSLHNPVQCLDFNWGIIHVGLKNGSVVRLNAKNLKVIKPHLEVSEQSILALRTTLEGPRKVLIVATRVNSINVRDATTGLLLRTVDESFSGTVYSLTLSSNILYCGTDKSKIYAFDFTEGARVAEYESGPGVLSIKLICDFLFASSYDGNIYVFNSKTMKCIGKFPGSGKMLLAMEIYKNRQIVSSSNDGKLEIRAIPLNIRNIIKNALS